MSSFSVMLFDNIFRVGSDSVVNDLQINSYLMIDEGDGILFGAGPLSDFENTLAAIKEFLPVDRLKYIVLHNSDPAVCSSIPLFEKNGFSGKIVTHWRTSLDAKYYGVTSEFVYSNLAANRLTLKSGRIIHFINTPYLKSAGALCSYDAVSGILFSGDLFSAFSKKLNIYAGVEYINDMKRYHSEYMPVNHMLREILDVISRKNISMIAPQYGSVIKQDIQHSISELMAVKCGLFFSNLKIEASGSDEIVIICNDLLTHFYSLFSKEEVLNVFSNSDIIIDENSGLIKGSFADSPESMWNRFFDIIVSRKGYRWLSLIESELKVIVNDHEIDYPNIYKSSFYELESKYEKLEKERASLLETLHAIEKEFQIPDNVIVKDPLAQVYKEDVFKDNLMLDILACRDIGIDFAFFIIEVDKLDSLNVKYGREAGDELLANTAYLLKNFKKASKSYAHHLIFRMNGPRFTYYCNDISREEVIDMADKIRTEFRESKLFITDITVSIGLVHSSDFAFNNKDPEDLIESIIEVANSRLRLAKHRGSDTVCSSSETAACFDWEDYILVVDPDISVRYMLETHLQNAGFTVISCAMGDEALEQIDLYKPEIIISGVMLPKIDGFTLRKKLLEDSELKDIPFIITSSVKDDKSIIRAQSLGIYHYFKKPFSIIELTGLVKNLTNK